MNQPEPRRIPGAEIPADEEIKATISEAQPPANISEKEKSQVSPAEPELVLEMPAANEIATAKENIEYSVASELTESDVGNKPVNTREQAFSLQETVNSQNAGN